MGSRAYAGDIVYDRDDRASGGDNVSTSESSELSEKDLAKIEALFERHAQSAEKAMASMSDAVEAMEDTVSEAIVAASKRSSTWIAPVSITVATLALFAGVMFWAFDRNQETQDRRLASYEETQENRLIAYEGAMGTVANNLQKLREENLVQIRAFSAKFDTMNDRIDGVHDAILQSIGLPYRGDVDDIPIDAAASPRR